jgi:hypothetical protein
VGHGDHHQDPVCAAVFATVINHPASRRPATSFALCGAHPPVAETLNRLQAPHFLQLYPGVDEAMDAVFARPPYLRDELLLVASDPHAPGGRGLWLIEQLTTAWGINRHRDGGKVVWCTLRR